MQVPPRNSICKTCGSTDGERLHTKGSFMVEVLFWLLLLLPGILYSVWRHTTREYVCRVCGSPDLIGQDTPIGKELMRQYGPRQENRD